MIDCSLIRSFCLSPQAWQGARLTPFGFLSFWRTLGGVFLAAFLAFSPAAQAEDLFAQFNALKGQAQALQGQISTAEKRASAHPFAPSEAYMQGEAFVRNVRSFSTLAAKLSAQIEAAGGPKDLRCIYRGMAADAKTRLLALQHAKNAGAQAIILRDMGALFADAIDVTPKSPEALSDRNDGDGGQCAADPEQNLETLPKH